MNNELCLPGYRYYTDLKFHCVCCELVVPARNLLYLTPVRETQSDGDHYTAADSDRYSVTP